MYLFPSFSYLHRRCTEILDFSWNPIPLSLYFPIFFCVERASSNLAWGECGIELWFNFIQIVSQFYIRTSAFCPCCFESHRLPYTECLFVCLGFGFETREKEKSNFLMKLETAQASKSCLLGGGVFGHRCFLTVVLFTKFLLKRLFF